MLSDLGYRVDRSDVFEYPAATISCMLMVLVQGSDALMANRVIRPDLSNAMKFKGRRCGDSSAIFVSMN